MHCFHNWDEVFFFMYSSSRGCYLLVFDDSPLVADEIESKVTSHCVSGYTSDHLMVEG